MQGCLLFKNLMNLVRCQNLGLTNIILMMNIILMNIIFNEYNFNKPTFYLRYVDDILAAFDNDQDSLFFLNFLNNRNPNIKFTIEKQINHSIVFLYVFISGINIKISHFKHITNRPMQDFS